MYSDPSKKIKPSGLDLTTTPITFLTVLAAWAAVERVWSQFKGKEGFGRMFQNTIAVDALLRDLVGMPLPSETDAESARTGKRNLAKVAHIQQALAACAYTTIHRPAEHALGPLRPAIRGGASLPCSPLWWWGIKSLAAKQRCAPPPPHARPLSCAHLMDARHTTRPHLMHVRLVVGPARAHVHSS